MVMLDNCWYFSYFGENPLLEIRPGAFRELLRLQEALTTAAKTGS
jgi:hypothetical protein